MPVFGHIWVVANLPTFKITDFYFAEVQRPAGTWQLGTAESTGSGGKRFFSFFWAQVIMNLTSRTSRLCYQKRTISVSQLVDLKQSQRMESVRMREEIILNNV